MGPNIIVKNWKWIALSLIFWFMAFRCIPRIFCDLGGDSAQYIILGESISKGLGLKLVNYPQEPVSFYFAPVLCFLLSPIIHFFGRNFYLMHILVAILGFLSLYFFYRIFKHYSDRLTATICIFLLATNWAFIIYSTEYILSDVPYLFFSGFTLFMATRYAEEGSCFNRSGILVIAGLLLSYFTRYSGIVLFLSIMAFLLLNSKSSRFGKAALVGSIFILVFAAWNLLESMYASRLASHNQLFFLIDPYAPDKGTILSHPLELVTRFAGGINRVFVLLGDITFFYFINKGAQLNDIFCGFIMIFVLLGLWNKFRENKHSIIRYYFLFYLVLIFLWLFNDFIEGVRYLLPILPFIIFYFVVGFFKALDFLAKRSYRVYFAVFMCIFFIFNIFNLSVLPNSSQLGPENLPVSFGNFVSLHDWIKSNLHDKGNILSRKPTITYLFTDHKSVVYPFTSNPDKIWEAVSKDNIKYIIADEFSRETYYYLLPFLYKYKDKLKLLYRIGETGLFEIKQRG